MAEVEPAQSLDCAAWGVLRLRFVRAVAASCALVVILVGAGLLLSAAAESLLVDREALDMAIGALIDIGFALAGIAFAVAVTGLASAVMHWTPRRLVALIAFVALLPAIVHLAQEPFNAIYIGLGTVYVRAHGVKLPSEVMLYFSNYRFWLVYPAIMTLALIVALEGVAWAGWQLTVSREGFLAARGWRPPTWQLTDTFRLRLGLPAFLANFGTGTLGIGMLYFAVAFLNVGIVAMVLAPRGLLFQSLEEPPTWSLYTALHASLVLLLLLNLLGVGKWLFVVANRGATALYQSVREWDDRAPVVFLRRFDQDKAALRSTTRDPFLRLAAGVMTTATIDEILLEHASPYGPVIAIGDPRDPTPPLGAARLFVPGADASWQDVVSGLVNASKAVVICPDTSEGVRWELDLIARSGIGPRTIYLASPSLTPNETAALFEALAPQGGHRRVGPAQRPIAAFNDPKRGWRVLSAKRLSVQTVTVALNTALQAMLGPKGVPLLPVEGPAAAKGRTRWARVLAHTAVVLVLYGVAVVAASIAGDAAAPEKLSVLERWLLPLAAAGIGCGASVLWLGRAADGLWSVMRGRAASATGSALAVAGVLATCAIPASHRYAMASPSWTGFAMFWVTVWMGSSLILLGARRILVAVGRRRRSSAETRCGDLRGAQECAASPAKGPTGQDRP